MTRPEKYSFAHYLEAKRTVDDRALNKQCWASLARELDGWLTDRPLQVLEAGAGVGTMVERFVEWGITRNLGYTAMDVDPTLLARALERLSKWAHARGWYTKPVGSTGLLLEGLTQRITVEFVTGDVFTLAKQENKGWDLVVAHAFLDLVDLHRALPCLFSVLRSSGFFYFTLVFNGVTVFQPPIDPQFDALIEACYHRSMDTQDSPTGAAAHSQTGRRLIDAVVTQGVSILAAGGSDWVVYPPYIGDEGYFLHHILHYMEESLRGCPDLEASRFARWLSHRHRQVEEERLIYIAHHIDVFGRNGAWGVRGF